MVTPRVYSARGFFINPEQTSDPIVRAPGGRLTKQYLYPLYDGSLGSRDDEERSEMRYAMRIAEFLESSDFRTQPALKACL